MDSDRAEYTLDNHLMLPSSLELPVVEKSSLTSSQSELMWQNSNNSMQRRVPSSGNLPHIAIPNDPPIRYSRTKDVYVKYKDPSIMPENPANPASFRRLLLIFGVTPSKTSPRSLPPPLLLPQQSMSRILLLDVPKSRPAASRRRPRAPIASVSQRA